MCNRAKNVILIITDVLYENMDTRKAKTMINKSFPGVNTAVLRSNIRAAGYSQAAVARILGISESTLYKKISGKSDFSMDEIRTLYRLLNLDNVSVFFSEIERR